MGGHRRYSEADVLRIRRAADLVGQGWAVDAAMAAVALVADGWRAVLIGSNVPAAAWEEAIDGVKPRVVLVGAAGRPAAKKFVADRPKKRKVLWLASGKGFRDEDEDSDLSVYQG